MLASKSSGRTPSRAGRVVGLGLALFALWLPCAVWAFPPDALPSAAIWTNFMQKIHEEASTQIDEIDQNRDGVVDLRIYLHADGSYIDVTLQPAGNEMIPSSVTLRDNRKDKKQWVYGFDTNTDGNIDMIVRGMFAENMWDQMIYDSDRDGRPDKFMRDMDQNGVYDFMGSDEDGDGRLDYLYDLDNKTGDIMPGTETVGWVTFTERQNREALPKLWYSFVPELSTLTGDRPTVVSATWKYGDGQTRSTDDLVQMEHYYVSPGEYEVAVEVEFRMPGSDKVWTAWSGVHLPIEPGPAGPAPLAKEQVLAASRDLYGMCGLVPNSEQPQMGLISELWPEAKLPETAPAGEALRNSAVAPGELELAVFWWRSDAEADAFLDALTVSADPKPDIPVMVVRAQDAQGFELASKQRAQLVDNKGVRTAAWREGPFVVTIRTNRTVEELQRWSRLLFDLLHPAPTPAPEPEG